MMDSATVDDAKLKHVASRDQLEAAFRRREVAVAALKAKMSKVPAWCRCHCHIWGLAGLCRVPPAVAQRRNCPKA